MKEIKLKPLAASILSLSLLTVMAGAAVAPALEVIREYFSDAGTMAVQLIVSIPALFIVITNLFFSRLASRFGSKTLVMLGLVLYTVGGCCAGLCSSIAAVLVLCAPIMAGLDLVAFAGGLAFVHIKRGLGRYTRFVAPAAFLCGYCLLAFVGGWVGTLAGCALVGFANGVGVPCIISAASANEGRDAATTVMPIISASLYLAQFVSPFLLSLVSGIVPDALRLPYYLAVAVSTLLLVCSAFENN